MTAKTETPNVTPFESALNDLRKYIDNYDFAVKDKELEKKTRDYLIDTVLSYDFSIPGDTGDDFHKSFFGFIQQVILIQSKKESSLPKPGEKAINHAKEALGKIIIKTDKFGNADIRTISYIARGLLHIETGHFRRAINDLNIVLEKLTDDISENNTCECIRKYYRECTVTPNDIEIADDSRRWEWWLIVIVLTYKGIAYYERQDYKKAYEVFCTPARMLSKQNEFRNAIAKKNKSYNQLEGWILFRCYSQKGKALIELGNLAEAMKWLLMAIKEIMKIEKTECIRSLPGGHDNTTLESEANNKVLRLRHCIDELDKIRMLGRIKRNDVWRLFDNMIGSSNPYNYFKLTNDKKFDIHKSDFINKIAYCLTLLSDDTKKDSLLDWFHAAVKFDNKNIFAHFNRLLIHGIGRKETPEIEGLQPEEESGIAEKSVMHAYKQILYDALREHQKNNTKHADRILAATALFGYMDILDRENEDKLSTDVFLKLMSNFDNIISAPTKFYNNVLKKRQVTAALGTRLMVLRRWNSFTPIVPRPRADEALGGGYFLIHHGKGIVIDPGFNFIQNLYNAGYSINDIDAVFVTHSHIDHCDDLDALMTLLIEKNSYVDDIDNMVNRKVPPAVGTSCPECGHVVTNDKSKSSPGTEADKFDRSRKSVDLFLNDGAIRKYSWLKPHENAIGRVYLLTASEEEHLTGQAAKFAAATGAGTLTGECRDSKHEIDLSSKYSLKVQVLKAKHKDFISLKSSVGLKFYLDMGVGNPKVVAFTSDTSYLECKEEPNCGCSISTKVADNNAEDYMFANQYKDADVLFLHIGDYNFKELNIKRSEDFADLLKHGRLIDLAQNAFILGVRDRHFKELPGSEICTDDAAKERIITALFDKKDRYNSNHLGFNGVRKIIDALNDAEPSRPRLAVISEYPEELGSFRHVISKKLRDYLEVEKNNKHFVCLSGDIGMEILLTRHQSANGIKVKCTKCADDNDKYDSKKCFHIPIGKGIRETCVKAEQMKIVYYCKDHHPKDKIGVEEFVVFTE